MLAEYLFSFFLSLFRSLFINPINGRGPCSFSASVCRLPDKENSAIPLSSKAWLSSNPITASGQICVQNRAPIDIKVLAGRADNESPIHIGSIATLGKLKKGAASIRLLSLSHSERKKKALLCLLPSSLIESKTHTSAYESYGFLTFSGNRFSPVLAGPCSNKIISCLFITISVLLR